jgi:outer membrane lipopolysaccharide assembly protein LptE/RlpB
MRCALIAMLALTGCGYHTAGKISTLPARIHVLAVPAFVNETHTYRVEQVLTSSVVRELTTRTNYQVIDHKDSEADATLTADVTQTSTAPLTYDSASGRATSSLVTVALKISLVDRKGKVLFSNPNYTFREEYEISQQAASFFNEESPALQRLSQDVARSLVSNILEGF